MTKIRKLFPREVIPLEVLEKISDNPKRNLTEIYRSMDKSIATITYSLQNLCELGLVKKDKIHQRREYSTTEQGEKITLAYKEIKAVMEEPLTVEVPK